MYDLWCIFLFLSVIFCLIGKSFLRDIYVGIESDTFVVTKGMINTFELYYYDSSKSTSYSVESILFSLTSKNIDCFDRIDESTAMFNRYGVPHVTSTLPVYQPIPSHTVDDHLSVINIGDNCFTGVAPSEEMARRLAGLPSAFIIKNAPSLTSFTISYGISFKTAPIKSFARI